MTGGVVRSTSSLRAACFSGRQLVGALIVIGALVIGACASTPDATVVPTNGPDPSSFRYSCAGTSGFQPPMLDQPGAAERGGDPPAAALRDILATDPSGLGCLPDQGWWLVGRTDTRAEFLAELPPALESPYGYIELVDQGGKWGLASGGSCTPSLVIEGRVPATWVLAHDQPAPNRGTNVITALVTDQGCTGGEPVGDRLLPPFVTYTEASVYIVFTARPHQGLTTCEGKPPTAALVQLREPLGNRDLLDAGVFPAAAPRAP